MTDIIIGPGDSPTAMVVNSDGSINVNAGGGGSATAALQQSVQSTYGSTTVNNVTIIDPSTGNPITYTAPTNVQGPDASGATITGRPLLSGGRAATQDPTAVTNGQAVAAQLTSTGRQVTAPYARHDAMVRGTTSGTDTGAHTILAAGSGSNKTYVTGLQLSNTSATTIRVTMSDDASSVFIVPATGGSNIVFTTPLATAAATAFTFTSSSGVSTIYASAQGYYAL